MSSSPLGQGLSEPTRGLEFTEVSHSSQRGATHGAPVDGHWAKDHYSDPFCMTLEGAKEGLNAAAERCLRDGLATDARPISRRNELQ